MGGKGGADSHINLIWPWIAACLAWPLTTRAWVLRRDEKQAHSSASLSDTHTLCLSLRQRAILKDLKHHFIRYYFSKLAFSFSIFILFLSFCFSSFFVAWRITQKFLHRFNLDFKHVLIRTFTCICAPLFVKTIKKVIKSAKRYTVRYDFLPFAQFLLILFCVDFLLPETNYLCIVSVRF